MIKGGINFIGIVGKTNGEWLIFRIVNLKPVLNKVFRYFWLKDILARTS